jgi:hypothetical protein
MEKRDPKDMASMNRPGTGRIVHAPAQHEGVGNALRAAFEINSYGLPDDVMGLLAKLDGK